MNRNTVEGRGLKGDLWKYLWREICRKFVEIFVLGEICRAVRGVCLWRSLGLGDIWRAVLKWFLIKLITHKIFLVLNIGTKNKLELKDPLKFVHTSIFALSIGSYQSVNVYISVSRKYVCNFNLLLLDIRDC